MKKTILVTGSTDGIGLETAKSLVTQGHHVLIHGRNRSKLEQAEKLLNEISDNASIESFMADLSRMNDVVALAKAITEKHNKLDVLINNAGVYKTPQSITQDGLDARFAVNTIAPYLLTQKLLPLLAPGARIINVSSAAQAPVDADALAGKTKLSDDFNVYAQSKLALTMWSRHMASTLKDKGPVIIAVNPGSLLGTKMVQEGFGIAGKDIRIGADILVRLALDDEFDDANGLYFDNDTGQLTTPHPDAMKPQKTERIVRAIEETLAECDEYD